MDEIENPWEQHYINVFNHRIRLEYAERALNLLDNESISKITKLPIEDIEQLRNEKNEVLNEIKKIYPFVNEEKYIELKDYTIDELRILIDKKDLISKIIFNDAAANKI